MGNEEKGIVLPRKLQIEMLQFFLKTSIPRIKAEKKKAEDKNPLSEISDRRD